MIPAERCYGMITLILEPDTADPSMLKCIANLVDFIVVVEGEGEGVKLTRNLSWTPRGPTSCTS
jgi:hypothetical protein